MAGKAIVRRSMFKFRYMQLYFKRMFTYNEDIPKSNNNS